MRINSLHIYGFGKWQDKQLDFNEQAMVTIVGDNEAGKSTIRHFIIFILFGFPPSERKRYLPKRGGQLGGQLMITADDGNVYTIERFHDRYNGEAICYDSNGQKLSSTWLEDQLNGIDRALYQKIFHFDVLSLQMKDRLSQDQLGEVLLSVGMTGSDRIYQTEKQIRTFLDRKFKPNGRKPELNQMLKQLMEKERALKKHEHSIQAYEKIQQQKFDYQKQVEEKQEQFKWLNEQFTLLKEQQRIYPAIEKYHLLTDELREFPNGFDFPEQGEESFRQIKEQLEPLQRDVELAKQQLVDLKEDLTQIEDKLFVEKDRELIGSRIEQIESYQEHVDQKRQLKLQFEEKNQIIDGYFTQLKLKLSGRELIDLPFNYTTVDEWQQLADQKARLTSELAQIEASLKHLDQAGAQLETEYQELKERVLSKQEKELLLDELEQVDERLGYQSERKSDPLKNWQKHNRYLSVISIGVMVLGLILLLFSENNLINGLLYMTVLIFVGLFLIKQKKSEQQLFGSLNEQNEEQLSGWLTRKSELTTMLADHDEHRDAFVIVEQERKRNNKEQLQKIEQQTSLKIEEERMEKAQFEQEQLFPFLADLSVQYWPDLAKQLLEMLDLIHERKQLKRRLESESAWLESFEAETLNQLDHLLNQNELSFKQQLDKLQALSIQQQNLLEQKEKVVERIDHQVKNINQIKTQILPYQNERDQLFNRVKVETDEEFVYLARQFQKWRTLNGQQAELERQIKLHLPEQVVNDIFAGAYPSISELELKLEQNQEKVMNVEQEISQLYQKVADQQAVLDQQARSTEIVNLKHDYYLMKEKFQAKAKEWLIHQIALKQIEKTKSIFQTSYLPDVLAKGAGFLAKMTNNRYTQLEFDQQVCQLFLVSEAGEPYQVSELSQGTLDQLFVALRLAVSSWLAEHIRLPFLIDDGFVHFDARRQENVTEILQELKNVHQIIYFTKSNPELEGNLSNDHHFIKLS